MAVPYVHFDNRMLLNFENEQNLVLRFDSYEHQWGASFVNYKQDSLDFQADLGISKKP